MSKIDYSQSDAKWQISINGTHKYRHENMPFDIDVWYPQLKDITYKTFFLPLIRAEAQSIIKYP